MMSSRAQSPDRRKSMCWPLSSGRALRTALCGFPPHAAGLCGGSCAPMPLCSISFRCVAKGGDDVIMGVLTGATTVNQRRPRSATAAPLTAPISTRRARVHLIPHFLLMCVRSHFWRRRALGVPRGRTSLSSGREAAYRVRAARSRRGSATAAPLTAPISTRRARVHLIPHFLLMCV